MPTCTVQFGSMVDSSCVMQHVRLLAMAFRGCPCMDRGSQASVMTVWWACCLCLRCCTGTAWNAGCLDTIVTPAFDIVSAPEAQLGVQCYMCSRGCPDDWPKLGACMQHVAGGSNIAMQQGTPKWAPTCMSAVSGNKQLSGFWVLLGWICLTAPLGLSTICSHTSVATLAFHCNALQDGNPLNWSPSELLAVLATWRGVRQVGHVQAVSACGVLQHAVTAQISHLQANCYPGLGASRVRGALP